MKVIPFERLRFKVESQSKPDVFYLVDLSEGNGECECPSFVLNKMKKRNLTCKHLRRCREYLADEVVKALRAQEEQ